MYDRYLLGFLVTFFFQVRNVCYPLNFDTIFMGGDYAFMILGLSGQEIDDCRLTDEEWFRDIMEELYNIATHVLSMEK